jgi:hypothetical protein
MPSALAARIPAPLLVHLTAAVILATVLWRPIYDSDLFWQLRLGELTLERGWPPDREPFLADRGDEALVPVAWLGQAVYALVRQVGGYPLLHVVDGLLWVSGLLGVAWSARRTGAGRGATLAALVLANFAAYSSVSTRPQTFGLVGFGLLVALARSDLSERARLALGFALLVAWQNFHPSAAVGGVWLAGVAAAGWGRALLRGGVRPWAATGLALLTPLAMAATPAGTRLFSVSAYNTEVSLWLGISEWMPLWELEVLDRLEAWIGLAAMIGLVLCRGRRVRTEDLVPAVILAVLAMASYRFVLFWAAAMIPVWAAALTPTRSVANGPAAKPLSRLGRVLAVLAWGLAVAIPTARHPTHLAGYFPDRAIRQLRSEVDHGPIYCNPVWAGLLIDAGYPDWRVTHDGRYYLQSLDEWRAYLAAGRGEVPVSELVHRYRPVAFVLRTGFDDGLIARLRGEPGWRELAVQGDCVVFVRANPASVVDTGPAGR